MPVVSFSNKEILRGKIVEPAWYRVKIESVGEAPAKASDKGPSTNYPVESVILFNGDSGATQFTGVPISWMFNSKAISFAIGFVESLGVEIKPDTRLELKAGEGMEIDVYVETDTYQGRFVNRVNHKYRKPKPEVTAVA